MNTTTLDNGLDTENLSNPYETGTWDAAHYQFGRVAGLLGSSYAPENASYAFHQGKVSGLVEKIENLASRIGVYDSLDDLEYAEPAEDDFELEGVPNMTYLTDSSSRFDGLGTICLDAQDEVDMVGLQTGAYVIAMGRNGPVGFEMGSGKRDLDREVNVYEAVDNEYSAHLRDLMLEKKPATSLDAMHSFHQGALAQDGRYHILNNDGGSDTIVGGLYVWDLN